MKKQIFLFLTLLVPSAAWAVRAPAITTKSLPAALNGAAYSTTVIGKFGTKPYSWSVNSGSLPTGLSLVAGTGVISGTPTVNNTFSFVIRLTDSAGSPKTYDRSFYIIVSASTPPPAVAVQITTPTPLPPGVVGSSYNTSLQAINGTAPYTWSVSAGAVPAGMALSSSTGVLSGTPTAPGTVSFSARVTDSSTTASVATQPYMIAVSNPTPAPTYLFTDALTSLAAWSYVSNATEDIIAACPGGGNCLQIHYNICGDSTNPACGSAHQDLNRYVRKDFSSFAPSGLSHVFVQGYLYQKAPEPDATPGKILQRKLLRLWTNLNGPSATNYEILLTSFSGTAGAPTNDIRLTLGYYGLGGTSAVVYDLATLNYNTLYKIEEEILLNTPGVADGTFKLWIDGVLVYSNTALALRNTQATNLNQLLVGDQVDRTTYYNVNEYRYWKNITVDDAFIP